MQTITIKRKATLASVYNSIVSAIPALGAVDDVTLPTALDGTISKRTQVQILYDGTTLIVMIPDTADIKAVTDVINKDTSTDPVPKVKYDKTKAIAAAKVTIDSATTVVQIKIALLSLLDILDSSM